MAEEDRYGATVFINCPFDPDYRGMFDAVVFTVMDCGFRPRCALEAVDSGQVRLDKIVAIIRESRFGVHDLSRTELDSENRLPRFNMPFELGLFLAAQRFGSGKQKTKVSLVLDREQYRYQKFISDIAGQDIRSHFDVPRRSRPCGIGCDPTPSDARCRAVTDSDDDMTTSSSISRIYAMTSSST